MLGLDNVGVIAVGFPCQPFSLLGRQEGSADRLGRGDLVSWTLKLVADTRPNIVLPENVAVFARTDGGDLVEWLSLAS